MSLFLRRRDARDGALIDVSGPLARLELVVRARERAAERVLLEAGIVEPGVIVVGRELELVLVLQAALARDGVLDRAARAVLLLKVGVGRIELRGAVARQALERKLEDDARALVLLLAHLELGKVGVD